MGENMIMQVDGEASKKARIISYVALGIMLTFGVNHKNNYLDCNFCCYLLK